MSNKKSLGKGLGALFSVFDEEENDIGAEQKASKKIEKTEVNVKSEQNVKGGAALEIDISRIVPNPNQPRKRFDETALKELAASIKLHGIIQPIVLNENDDNTYMIIAGERRWRAAQIAGMKKVPAFVRNYTERQIKEIALIENLQREDLNPIEAAKAIRQLMDEYNFTQEVVADRIGKSRPAIANTLRLLTLPDEILVLIEENKLSAGHAKCLVSVPDKDLQIKIAQLAVSKKMSVRDLEKLVKNALNPSKSNNAKNLEQSIELKEMVSEMQRVFSTKVSAIGSDRKGRIYIDYYSRDDLDRICDIIELIKAKTLTLKDLNNFNKHKV